MKKTGFQLERRMGQVTLWRQEREDEVQSSKQVFGRRRRRCRC